MENSRLGENELSKYKILLESENRRNIVNERRRMKVEEEGRE
jgi:hypothetical protein